MFLIILEDETNNSLWLKNNREPLSEVLSHWEGCFNLRQQNKCQTLTEYLLDWPILKNSFGHILVHNLSLLINNLILTDLLFID